MQKKRLTACSAIEGNWATQLGNSEYPFRNSGDDRPPRQLQDLATRTRNFRLFFILSSGWSCKPHVGSLGKCTHLVFQLAQSCI